LRDEGEAYGRKLVKAGNEVTMKRFGGVPHPFMHMDAGMYFSVPTTDCFQAMLTRFFSSTSG